MSQCDELLALLMEAVKQQAAPGGEEKQIPVGVSNRHVHRSQSDLDRLFGPGHTLEKMKDLS